MWTLTSNNHGHFSHHYLQSHLTRILISSFVSCWRTFHIIPHFNIDFLSLLFKSTLSNYSLSHGHRHRQTLNFTSFKLCATRMISFLQLSFVFKQMKKPPVSEVYIYSGGYLVLPAHILVDELNQKPKCGSSSSFQPISHMARQSKVQMLLTPGVPFISLSLLYPWSKDGGLFLLESPEGSQACVFDVILSVSHLRDLKLRENGWRVDRWDTWKDKSRVLSIG